MRLAAGSNIAAVAIAVAVLLAGCQHSSAPDTAAATRSRAQVVPAAHELYRTLFHASARSVDIFDWGYKPCGNGTATLSYTVSLRLFAFAVVQDTDFEAFRRQVVSLVREDGWTLQKRPPTRSVALPSVPSAYYRLSKRAGTHRLSGAMGLVGDPNPLVGVTGTISMNGPCFDAGGSAGSLQSQSGRPPFPVR